jgi:hypothetical protein
MARYNTVSAVTTQSGAATLSNPSQGLFTTLTGTAPFTVTLSSPAIGSGQTIGFFNNTGGVVTLSTPSGAIKGPAGNSASSYIMQNQAVVFLLSDGTNYILTSVATGAFINVDVTGPVTAVASQLLWCNTTSGPITVTLPATPAKGDTIRIIDVANTFNTNTLTVNRNGQPINGDVSGNLTVTTQGAAFDLIFYDATRGWRIFTI